MEWLIAEVFGPAKDIGDWLAGARNDEEALAGIPLGILSGGIFRGTPYTATKSYVFRTHCQEPLAQMIDGLKRADQELANLPPDVATEIRNLQQIVNGSVGTISLHEDAMYYAGSDIGEYGRRGWSAVIRNLKGVPFPSAAQPSEAPAGDTDAELLRACGLPAEPAANVRKSFDMAVQLIQRSRDDGDAAAAVALATAVARAGGQNVQSLPFGYEGPGVEHEGWLRREDLTRWLTQLGSLVAGGRFNADSARLAVEYALREYWLRAERFDAWRPGMPSGSGWTDVIQPQAAGIARATQMAAEPASWPPVQVTPAAIAPAPDVPWRDVAQAATPEPAAEANNGPAVQSADAVPETKEPQRCADENEDHGDTQAVFSLLKVFTNGLADERLSKAAKFLQNDTLTTNDKLTEIDALMPFPATASSQQLGALLGVTKQAVMKTDWWIQHRKGERENEIGRRGASHRDRAKQYEGNQTGDADE
jgi:hypothetical protein